VLSVTVVLTRITSVAAVGRQMLRSSH
jgi:hypothetical protein